MAEHLPSYRRVHILGRKNHGKTTLVVELVQVLVQRGLRVGTVKHTHHSHELDTPGKDSHRHRQAGAAAVGILSKSMNAVFWPTCENGENRYAEFGTSFRDCDIVLVEGDTQAVAPKIEVWRAELGDPPLAAENHSIGAVVTDDALPIDRPSIRRSELAAVADEILRISADAP